MQLRIKLFLVLSIGFLITSGCQKMHGTGTPNPEARPEIPVEEGVEGGLEKLSFIPAADTNTKSTHPDQVKGTSDKIDIWSTENEEKTGFMKFNLSEVDNSAQVEKAYIRFYFYDIRSAGEVNYYSVHGEWDEDTLTFNKSFELGLELEGSVSIYKELEGSHFDLEVTELVRRWVDQSVENHGIAMSAPYSGKSTQIEFFSKESISFSSRLHIEFRQGE